MTLRALSGPRDILSGIPLATLRTGTWELRDVFTFNEDLTIPSNVALHVLHGAILRPAAGVTVTIQGAVTAGLFQWIDVSSGGTVRFTEGSTDTLYPEWWYDGGGDWNAAITAALGATDDFKPICVRLPQRTYAVTGKIVVPEIGGSVSRAVTIEGGVAGGATQKTRIVFDGDDAGLEWENRGDNVALRNLVISHTTPEGFDPTTLTNIAPLADHGTGIKLTGAKYVTFENVWVEYFNVGVTVDGPSFYSTFHGLRCHYNYSQGMLLPATATMNGDGFYDCQFSNTLNGVGFEADFSGSVAVAFRSTYFENNTFEGLRAKGFLSLALDSCYFEQNESFDIICENLNPHQTAMLKLDNVYIDVASRAAPGSARIYLDSTPFVAINCRLYSTDGDGTAPIFIARLGEAQPQSVAINCLHDSPTLTNLSDDQGIVMLDHKHPLVSFASALPTFPSAVKAGSMFYNTDESTPNVIGWRCLTSGAAGGAQGPVGNAFTVSGGTTASTTNGSKIVTLSRTTHAVKPGDFIEIAGVSFGAGESFARVEEVLPGPSLILDRNALVTSVGSAITYRVATWQTITIDGSGFVKAS